MNRLTILIFLLFISLQDYAQCDSSRYISPIFNVIDVQTNVEYGQAPQWSFPYFNETLLMDVYQPLLDPIDKRPCIIWAHAGGFAIGDKQTDDMVALCDSFARRGYVTATIGYRKGFNPLDASSSERAVYRGLQDGRAAYRYLVENHEAYEIDTTKIFFGGSSAGALIAQHMAYVDEDERPNSSFEQGFAPDLECLDCTGNNFQHDVNPLGIISLWGAIGDTIWVDNDVHTLLVHGTEDPIVPYETGPPFELFTLPDVFGSSAIHERMQNQGFSSELIAVEGEGHEPHGTLNGYWINPPNEFWGELFTNIESFCYELIRPEPAMISGPEFICEGEFDIFSVELGDGEYVCWDVVGANFQEPIEGDVAIQIIEESAQITAFIFNEVGAASESHTLVVEETSVPDIAWDVSAEGGIFEYSVLTLLDTWWYLNGNLISQENTGSMILKSPGDYTVSLIIENEDGCTITYSDSFTTIIDDIIEEDYSNTQVMLVSGGIHIKSDYITEVSLFDLTGRLVYHRESDYHLIQKNSGVYLVSYSNEKESRVIKIVIP